MSLNDKIFLPELYTYKDYEQWKGNWELINGYPISKSPSPKRKHQFFSSKFNWYFRNLLVSKNLQCNCEVYSELDWIINDDTVVRPDAMIVCGKFETDFLTFPPALILEITSPTSRMRDRNSKFILYEMSGVKFYIIADPDKQTTELFELISNKYTEVNTTNLKLTDNCTLEIELNKIW